MKDYIKPEILEIVLADSYVILSTSGVTPWDDPDSTKPYDGDVEQQWDDGDY